MNHRIILFTILLTTILVCCSGENLTNIPNIKIIESDIRIGNQIWKNKNLDVSHYRNGDTIPQVTDPKKWSELTTGAWCYYDNNPQLGAILGKLYNWYAINDPRGIAPDGWHIPSNNEWEDLIGFLGGDHIAGGKLKYTGGEVWKSPNYGATNEFGFSGLPAGYRDGWGTFSSLSELAYFYSSSESDNAHSVCLYLYYNGVIITRDTYILKQCGFSVRCIKDN